MKLTNEQKLALFDCLGSAWEGKFSHLEIKNVLGLYSCYDAAKRLGVPQNQISYHVAVGHIPPLTIKVGERLYWTKEKYEEAIKYCSIRHYTPRKKIVDIERQQQVIRMYESGKFRQMDLAKMFGVSQTNISRIVNRK